MSEPSKPSRSPIGIDYPPTPADRSASGVTARHLDALATIGCAGLALLTIAFAAFRFLGPVLPTGASRNPDRAFFHAVNVMTGTGFSTNAMTAADLPAAGRVLVLTLALAGALLMLLAGGWFLRPILGMPIRFRMLLGVSLLLLGWPIVLSPGIGWFDALACASGLGWAVTPGLLQPTMSDWRWFALAASVPATIGPLLIVSLVTRRGSSLAQRTAAACAIASLCVLLLFLACGTRVERAAFESLNIRSLGLPGEALSDGPVAFPWAAMLSMAVGAGPGSTAGGLGLLPIVLGLAGTVSLLRGRAVSPIVGVALAWIALFGLLMAGATLVFLMTGQPMPGDRQLFLIVSALCNVGVSHDPIGITGPGLIVLSVTMLLGRVLPLVMLCWMAIAAERSAARDVRE